MPPQQSALPAVQVSSFQTFKISWCLMDHSTITIIDANNKFDHSTPLRATGDEDSSSSSCIATSLPTPVPTPSTPTTTSATYEESVHTNKFSSLIIQMICALSCIAVSIDPLFLYIPFIDETKKCLGVDRSVRDAALILRSLTDIPFLILMIGRIRASIKKAETETIIRYDESNIGLLWTNPKEFIKQSYTRLINFEKSVARRMPKYTYVSFIIDFLSLLPVPQVALVHVFFGLKGAGFVYERSIMNVHLLFQYLPRIGRIRLYRKEIVVENYFIRAAFDFYLYILASHVLGAIWYLFSIQRETLCWHNTCKDPAVCPSNYCHDAPINSTTIALLNGSCPINPADSSVFDFGIYLDAMQSGITGPRKGFPTKFFYALWWGFRNMSNFGTNLETSTYLWENCFAILISAIGLLLFLYLIGNVQIYIGLAANKSREAEDKKSVKVRELKSRRDYKEKIKRTRRLRKRPIRPIIREVIRRWMPRNCLREYIKAKVMQNIRTKGWTRR